MTVAILALQGAFAEHQQMLLSLGVDTTLIRNLSDWQEYIKENQVKALVLPGGESTAMMRILHDEGLFEPIRESISGGLPVLGTCAGLILLDRSHLGTMDMQAKRNAYGRQLGSFCYNGKIQLQQETELQMVFIRAPYIQEVGPEVDVLARVDGRIVAARQGKQLVTAFHPELTDDTRLHSYFLSLAAPSL